MAFTYRNRVTKQEVKSAQPSTDSKTIHVVEEDGTILALTPAQFAHQFERVRGPISTSQPTQAPRSATINAAPSTDKPAS